MRFLLTFGSGTFQNKIPRTPRLSGAGQGYETVFFHHGWIPGDLGPELSQPTRIRTVEGDIHDE
jgi:hypothetical protein